MKAFLQALVVVCGFASLTAQAVEADKAKQYETAQALFSKYSAEARKTNPNAAFSADAGRAFYVKKVAKGKHDFACASCHGENPAQEGKHIETGKSIKPLAISANNEAFSSVAKAEKAFAKHCRDLYSKDCSAQDKGDYVTYMLSVK